MMKIICFIFTFLLSSCFYSQENSVYLPVRIAVNNPQYKELKSKYGDLWLKYKEVNQKYKTGTGKDRFIIEKVYYYYKQNDMYICLGSVDKNGLYDKDGKEIFTVSIKQSEKLGLSSKLLETPLAPCVVIKTKDGLIKETNAVVLIDFDMLLNSIRVFKPNLK